MKKIKKIFACALVGVLIIGSLSGCGTHQKNTEGMSDLLNNTDWLFMGTGKCVTFEQPGKEKGYFEWDLYDGKVKGDYAGTYHLYEEPDSKVSEFQKKIPEYETGFNDSTESYFDRMKNEKPIVLVVDLEDPSANSQTETGMQTHFEYYGFYAEDSMFLFVPGSDEFYIMSKY